MSRERIGYVLKMYPRFSETFVLTELLQLQDQGVDVEVFSLRKPADGRFHQALARMTAPVTYVGSAAVRSADLWAALGAAQNLPGWERHHGELWAVDVGDAAQALELAGLVLQRDITHLHAHFASVSARVARLAALLADITYSVTTHAKDIFHDDVDPVDLGRTLRDARTVVAISEYNAAHLAARFPTIADRIVLVRNGLDLSEFVFTPGVAGRPRRVAAIGRLVTKKGFADLVHATAQLVARGDEVVVDLVGTGELAGELQELVVGLGLSDRIILHGALPQHRVREIVAGAAVLAAPCIVAADGNRDGLPTVLLEAMALGTPCISTPVTGIAEAVRHEQTGLLVPPGDPVSLAVALHRLLDDRELGERLALAARDLVEQDYDTVRQVRRLTATFPALQGVSA